MGDVTRSILRQLFYAWLCLSSSVYAACTVVDDAGKTISLAKPASRIVSLAPDLTEILFAIGAGQQVVGVIEGSDFPPAAQKIPHMGSYSGIDVERILLLHPDLIVTWGQIFSRQLAPIATLGIPIYMAESHQLIDIPRTIKQLGCLTATQNKAEQVATSFSQRLNELQKKYMMQKKVTVFYQLGDYSLLTINKESWINQAITLCGGQNIFANAKTIAPEISWEAVVVANPQVIISDATTASWQKPWAAWPDMIAVKQHMLFTIHPDLIERAGPRLVNGVQLMCAYIAKARV